MCVASTASHAWCTPRICKNTLNTMGSELLFSLILVVQCVWLSLLLQPPRALKGAVATFILQSSCLCNSRALKGTVSCSEQ